MHKVQRKLRLLVFAAALVLVSPMLFSSEVQLVGEASATSSPIFWQVQDVTIEWGPHATDSGLVAFLESKTPRRARTTTDEVQSTLDNAGSSDFAKMQAAWESTNITHEKMGWLVDRFLNAASVESNVRSAYLQSMGATWTVNSQRTYTRDTLPLDPLPKALKALYEVLGLSLDLNQELELVNSLSYVDVAVQGDLANLVFASVDAMREVEKARPAGSPPLGVLARDAAILLDVTQNMSLTVVDDSGPIILRLDIQPEYEPLVASAVSNLTGYKPIHHAQANIFLIQAVREVVADLRDLPEPPARPTSPLPCEINIQPRPLFVDPHCKLVFESSLGLTHSCGDIGNIGSLEFLPIVVGSNRDDVYDCPYAATWGGASLLLDSGGRNTFSWDAAQREGRDRWAFGASFGGAALLWDEGCSVFNSIALHGGLGAGLLGTAVVKTGLSSPNEVPDWLVTHCDGVQTRIVSDGPTQGVGAALGIGILSFDGAEGLRIERKGENSQCMLQTVATPALNVDCVVVSGINLYQPSDYAYFPHAGSGVGYLGGAGLVLAQHHDGDLWIENRRTWYDDEACPGSEIGYAAQAGMLGLGLGYAGLGMVASAGTTANTFVVTNPCPADYPLLTQGWGGLLGIGLVSSSNLGEVQRVVGTRSDGVSSLVRGIGVGFVKGVGAAVDVSSSARYQLCRQDVEGLVGDADPVTRLKPCTDSTASGTREGAGLGGMYGIGLLKHSAAGGSGANAYLCDIAHTRCFGGSSLHTGMLCCLVDSLVRGVGLFADDEGVDLYRGGANELGNDRHSYVWDGASQPLVTGFFRDCAQGASCGFRQEGFEQ